MINDIAEASDKTLEKERRKQQYWIINTGCMR